MKKERYNDFELIIDIERLIDKYGSERISDAVDYLLLDGNRTEVLAVLKRLGNFSKGTSPSEPLFENLSDHDKNTFMKLQNLLNDKKLFQNVKKIESFTMNYGFNVKVYKKKSEKVEEFIKYTFREKPKCDVVLETLLGMKQSLDNNEILAEEQNQLEKWADLIVEKTSKR